MIYLLTFLGGAAALAASASTATEIPWWGQLIITVAGTFGTLLLGLLGRALNKLFDFLAAKTRIAKLAEVDEYIMGYVTKVYEEEVKYAKLAAADGKLTEKEKARLKQIPIDAAKAHFGIKPLLNLIGDGLEDYLGTRVVRSVAVQKIEGASKKVAKATTKAVAKDPS